METNALHDFIATGNDIEGLRELLVAGANPNSQDDAGRTPLHILLLKSERNPEDTDEHLLVARELIRFGANVNQGNTAGKTPLHFAIGFRHYKMTEMLLDSNSEIDQTDSEGYTALHYATSRRRFRRGTVYETDPGIVRLVLRYNPDVDMQSRDRETALMLAVRNGNLYIIRELLKKNASVNLQDLHGNTAMHYAFRRPEVNLDVVLDLLRNGCSFVMTNHHGTSPISLYFRQLIDAPRAEVEKSKYVFKLYLFDRNGFNDFQRHLISEISRQNNCQLSRFLRLCSQEIEQMILDEIEPTYTVYDIALRGTYCRFLKNDNHIPISVFDKVLDKLKRRQYPVYCDLIAAGICNPYMNKQFAEMCCRRNTDSTFLDFDGFYEVSKYLSNFDMLNMMIAGSGGWRRFWYLPRFTYFTRCSVS